MQIAPNFDSTKWKTLQLDDPESSDWGIAVAVLSGRIQERYFDPMDILIAAEKDKPATKRRFGFSILAIDCLLIETLGAFLLGLTDTDSKSKKVFSEFLTTRIQFSGDFDVVTAEQFYTDFRCGILHQAEVGRSSKVWSVGDLIQIKDNGIIVNRNEFHKRLKDDFEVYLKELMNPKMTKLRTNFRKKMDFIAR